MKKVLKVILIVFVVFVLVLTGGMFIMTRGLDEGSKLAVNPVNMPSVGDGIYDGKYDSGRWSNELKVTVKDHKITKIDIVKDVTFPKPEWSEQLFNEVIENQNTDVDIVSGATVTSKAYLKSIENALKKGE